MENMMNTETLSVANTISMQIGSRAFAMLGAHALVGDSDRLMFAVRGCKKINKVVVILAPDDTYTVEFWKIGRSPSFKCDKVSEVSMVYAENLNRVIESATGLYTTL